MRHSAILAILGCGCSGDGSTPFSDLGGDDTAETDDTGPKEFDSDDIRELACDGALPVFAVCPCDFAIGWSGITADIYGEAVDPTGFEVLGWTRSSYESAADVLTDICEGHDFSLSDTYGYADVDVAGATTTHLSEMAFLGTPVNVPEPGETHWLLWTATDQPGFGVRVVALVDVVDGGADSIEMVWP
jgi:hypothetical protein